MVQALKQCIAVALCMTAIGALAGFLFGDRFLRTLATDDACFALSAGKRLKYLDETKQATVIKAVMSSPEIFPQTKEIMLPAKPGC